MGQRVGHDDGALIELEAVADEVYDGVVHARTIEGGVEIVTTQQGPRSTDWSS
ncbi:MAG: hypothetical protein ACRDVD_00850 [Acidimicrobiia bacterium]